MLDAATEQILRQAAFLHVERLFSSKGILNSDDLRAGFHYQGKRVPLVNPQRGIFKPADWRNLLSIRTVFPRKGGKVWYHDQTTAHEAVFRGEEVLDYAFMGKNPDAADNRWLKQAYEEGVPVIYFLGVSPGAYIPRTSTFILGWDASALTAKIGFSAAEGRADVTSPEAADRRYGMRLTKQRLHQAAFRERLLAAYDGRCAISGLPERRLIDAAHIVRDADEELGQPVIVNGLPLSKIHHAAFDAHLIGIDPDCRIHVAHELLELHDGPMLEQGLKGFDGQLIRPPKRESDRPDRDRLAQRFEQFRLTAESEADRVGTTQP